MDRIGLGCQITKSEQVPIIGFSLSYVQQGVKSRGGVSSTGEKEIAMVRGTANAIYWAIVWTKRELDW